MKITLKNGVVIDNVGTEELPIVLAMSDPGAVLGELGDMLAQPFKDVFTSLRGVVEDVFGDRAS